MKFFMNGLNSTNNTFRFLSEHACTNRGSTVGKNMNYIMWTCEVPPVASRQGRQGRQSLGAPE